MNDFDDFNVVEPAKLAKLKLSVLEADKTVLCEKEGHGEFTSRNVFGSIWTKCPKCNEIEKIAKQADDEAKDRAEKLRIWQNKLGEAGIPERFHDRTLENYSASNDGQRNALNFATTYAESFGSDESKGRSAIFCGKPGTGKNHLATAIGMSLMKRGKSVAFITVQRMVRRVKDSWRNDSDESESDVISMLTWPDLLILDEIGVQFGTDFEKNLLFDVLNTRYEKRKSTLLLSNLPASEVKNFLGDRVYDRLREDKGQCIPFDWQSSRGKV